MTTLAPVSVMGKRIYPFPSKESLMEYFVSHKGILIALNAEKLMNPSDRLLALVNRNIGYADGAGAVLAIKKKGKQATRLPGVELWLHLVTNFCETKSFYFIGSTQEVIQKTIRKLKADFPSIRIRGFRNGYIKSDLEKQQLIRDIQESKPDFVFVAQGSPRQEYLMEEISKVYPANYMGLGGSFEVYIGLKKRCPKIFQVIGLEWLYRLLIDYKRYKRVFPLLKFALRLLTSKL